MALQAKKMYALLGKIRTSCEALSLRTAAKSILHVKNGTRNRTSHLSQPLPVCSILRVNSWQDKLFLDRGRRQG